MFAKSICSSSGCLLSFLWAFWKIYAFYINPKENVLLSSMYMYTYLCRWLNFGGLTITYSTNHLRKDPFLFSSLVFLTKPPKIHNTYLYDTDIQLREHSLSDYIFCKKNSSAGSQKWMQWKHWQIIIQNSD